MSMKAITLTQPWAELVAIGAKTIETRNWSSPYRGWLAIHAAKGFPMDAVLSCHERPFRSVLLGAGFRVAGDLPRGAIVAVANLHRIGHIGWFGEDCYVAGRDLPVEGDELELGDFTPGRFGWVLTNVRRLPEPIPCRGMIGLWDVPADVVARIEESLGVLA